MKPSDPGNMRHNRCSLCQRNQLPSPSKRPSSSFGFQLVEISPTLSTHNLCLSSAYGLQKKDACNYTAEEVAREVKRCEGITCTYCKLKGASVKCKDSGCSESFHLSCLYQEYKDGSSKRGKPVVSLSCREHDKSPPMKRAHSATTLHESSDDSPSPKKVQARRSLPESETTATGSKVPSFRGMSKLCQAVLCISTKGTNYVNGDSWKLKFCSGCSVRAIHLACHRAAVRSAASSAAIFYGKPIGKWLCGPCEAKEVIIKSPPPVSPTKKAKSPVRSSPVKAITQMKSSFCREIDPHLSRKSDVSPVKKERVPRTDRSPLSLKQSEIKAELCSFKIPPSPKKPSGKENKLNKSPPKKTSPVKDKWVVSKADKKEQKININSGPAEKSKKKNNNVASPSEKPKKSQKVIAKKAKPVQTDRKDKPRPKCKKAKPVNGEVEAEKPVKPAKPAKPDKSAKPVKSVSEKKSLVKTAVKNAKASAKVAKTVKAVVLGKRGRPRKDKALTKQTKQPKKKKLAKEKPAKKAKKATSKKAKVTETQTDVFKKPAETKPKSSSTSKSLESSPAKKFVENCTVFDHKALKQQQKSPETAKKNLSKIFESSASGETDLKSNNNSQAKSKKSAAKSETAAVPTDLKAAKKLVKKIAVEPTPISERQLYHVLNNQAQGEEPEAEESYQWLIDLSKRQIDEFVDLNQGEKDFFKLWNQHIFLNPCYGDQMMITVLRSFIDNHAVEIMERNLYKNFMLHLNNFYDYAVLTPMAVVEMVQRFQTVSSGQAAVTPPETGPSTPVVPEDLEPVVQEPVKTVQPVETGPASEVCSDVLPHKNESELQRSPRALRMLKRKRSMTNSNEYKSSPPAKVQKKEVSKGEAGSNATQLGNPSL